MSKILASVVALALVIGLVSLTKAEDKKPSGGVSIGDKAPQFSLQDQDGKLINSDDLKGKIVVLEWFNNGCPFVVRHYEKMSTMNDTAGKYKDQGVVWLSVNSTKEKTNADNKAVHGKWNMNHAILNDAEGNVGHLYGATNTPHVFIIDKDSKVAYMGAIDNDPEGNKSAGERVNYADKALGELLEGKPVSEPQTKQYGCTVKYAK